MDAERATDLALAQLEQHGLLLMQDAAFPSLVSLIAGEPIVGSWWSHPRNRVIYDVLQALMDKSLVVKLIAGKRTFVHRRLWPAVCAVGESNAPWQRDKLRPDALELLARVRACDALRTDIAEPLSSGRKVGAVATDLEKRILIHATDEHTEAGNHARVLEAWPRFRARAKLSDKQLPSADDAREQLGSCTRAWSGKARVLFPWS